MEQKAPTSFCQSQSFKDNEDVGVRLTHKGNWVLAPEKNNPHSLARHENTRICLNNGNGGREDIREKTMRDCAKYFGTMACMNT